MSNAAAGVPDVTVVVAAAGVGSRLGGERKQLRLLGDAPLLVQTLRAFELHPLVRHIVVAGPPGEADALRDLIDRSGLRKCATVIPGGKTRQESVRLGIEASPDGSGVVLIHDAVRPFVSQREITDVIRTARVHGAASVAIRVVDTLRRSSGLVFGETVTRDGLLQVQTPQGFARELILAAHRMAAAERRDATDDVAVAQMAGYDVHVVEGSSDNFKITTPADWRRAELLWDAWRRQNRS